MSSAIFHSRVRKTLSADRAWNGLLSPAITATPKGDSCSCFLAQDATSGEPSIAAETSSFGEGNRLVSFGSVLQADCAALGVRPGASKRMRPVCTPRSRATGF